MQRIVSKFLNVFLRFIGYKILINNYYNNSNYKFIVHKSQANVKSLNLNIGAGEYKISGFKSLDYYTEYYFLKKKNFKLEYINYDIRNDDIPFDNNTIDNIYVSHVIEHIEEKYVERFIAESYRVLKKNGVMRISCPDAKFLYNISQFENDYWEWRHKNFKDQNKYITDWSTIENYDFLIRELSTPRGRSYKFKKENYIKDYNEIKKLSFKELKKILPDNLSFRETYPGDHISIWDFDTLRNIGLSKGFSFIIESKYRGSISKIMQGPEFDITFPHMSLYVDFKK